MKNLILPATIAAVAFAINPAQAESAYIGTSFGKTQVDFNISPAVGQTSDNDEESTVAKYYLGVEINKYFAIEGGYADYGAFAYTHNAVRNNIEAKGMFLDAVGKLPLASSLSLFGKIGLTRTGLKVDVKDYTNGFRLGFGGEYLFSSSLAVRGEYEAISELDFVDKTGTTGSGLQIQMLSVGLTYRYGGTLR